MSGYDTGTRIWTTTFGVLLAAVLNWLAVINPARGFRADMPHTGWWLLGLVVIVASPAAWLAGRLSSRDYSHAVVWLAVLTAVVIAHWIPLSWAQDKT